jgi:transposase
MAENPSSSPSTADMPNHPNFDRATRAQVLAYKTIGLSNKRIQELTGIEKDTANGIVRKAIERGFDPNATPAHILDAHVEDGKRSGRPTK